MNNSTSIEAIIVDIDGTIALRCGRGPYEWEKIDSDVPNIPVVDVVTRLVQSGLFLVLVTGREERYREETSRWIERIFPFDYALHCRRDNDYRSDAEIKHEMFKVHIRDRYSVVAVFDDRSRVVQMWRESLGLTCLQVAPGDF